MRLLFIASALTVFFVTTPAVIVRAQEVPERRPVQALFGAPDPRGDGKGGLSATGSIFGSYDDNILLGNPGSEGRVPFLPSERLRGAATGYVGSLFFELPSEQPTFRASLESAGRYFPSFGKYVPGRQTGDVLSSASASLWRDASLRFTGDARYSMNSSPFMTASQLSPSDVDFPDGEDGVRLRRTNDVHGQVQLEQNWNDVKSLSVLGGIHSSQIDGSERHEMYEVGARYGHRVARNGAFRAGYTRQEVDRGVGTTYIVHHLNIGADYSRPLSASRRAFIAFSGGSAALETRNNFRLHAIGNADLWYEFKQSWITSLRYHRGFTFVDEIADPLLSDGVRAELTGLISPRLELNSSGNLAWGVAGTQRQNSYDMYSARAQLRYALTRKLAVYAEYLRFRYHFADAILLNGSLPSAFERQTVRVGFTVRTQLVDLGRR